MFNPTLLSLLRLLAAHPAGVGREEIRRELREPHPEWVERALGHLLGAGVVEPRGDRLVPRSGRCIGLARKMDLLARRINREGQEKDRAMGLVKMLFGGP